MDEQTEHLQAFAQLVNDLNLKFASLALTSNTPAPLLADKILLQVEARLYEYYKTTGFKYWNLAGQDTA